MAESFASISRYGAPRTRYDVFLSFRGEDTRSNFIGCLLAALRSKGILTFVDSRILIKGEELLIKAIRESKISIIIFSENYASSSWCLDGLVKSLECRKSFGRLVWPVFLRVEPSEVRNQTGNFGEALAKHERFMSKEKLAQWKGALTEASNLSGWHLADGDESQLIQRIVGAAEAELIKISRRVPLHVTKYPVGIEDRLLELETLIDVGTGKKDVKFIGIYGIGGVGKTTIAKAFFNKFADEFEVYSFLANVRDISKHLGSVHLQQTLLFDMLGDNNLKGSNIHIGINIIKERLCNKRVLLILDDVDELDQLETLAGGHEWFGLGSRIIITTRNKHLLKTHGADGIYEVRVLDHCRSVELFSWNAFKRDKPFENYLTLSDRILRYAGGLPLALQVLGSFLCGKSKRKWEIAMHNLEENLDEGLYQVLKISYDALQADEKALFHDIACFFVGKDKDFAVKVLGDLSTLDPIIGIQTLTDLSLINVESNRLRMHHLIEEMARKIVLLDSHETGKLSRLWSVHDVSHVSSRKTVANLKVAQCIAWKGKTDDIKNELKEVFDRLQPCKVVQDDFNATENTQEQVFQDVQDANLKDDQSVAWSGDTDVIKNINEKVSDNGPKPLTELQKQHFWVQFQLYKAKIFPNWGGHGSFSCIVEVHLGYCKSCYCLPPLGELPFLKKLHIQGFDRVERVGEEFYSSDTLSLSKPFKSLESLTFSHMLWWKEWSFMKSGVFSDLKQLTLDNCRELEGKSFPNYFPALKSLLILGCKQQVVASLSTDGLPLLSFLKIGHCKGLKSFPIGKLPANVDTVKIMGCKELDSLSDDGWPSKLKSLEISYCRKLFGNSLWWNLRTLTSLTSLQIIKIDEVVDSFPEEWQLPTTLKSLTLRHFRNLKSLNGKALQHHTSLKELKIEFCHHLHYLPEEGLPDSLSQLEISGCGFLNGRCQKERGEDWPKISHIPRILIDSKEL